MLKGLRDRNLSARLRQPADEIWDRRLGIRTFGYHPGTGGPGEREWYMHYIPSSYRDVFAVLKQAGVQAGDVVTDLGCGLGRVVFAASHLGAARAEGVELVPELVQAARDNLARSTLKDRDIAFIEADARAHDFGAMTLLYMFHPFGEHILAGVVEKAAADRRRVGARQPLRVAYVNPVCEHVLRDAGWFRPVGRMAAQREWLSNADHYEAAFWESTDV